VPHCLFITKDGQSPDDERTAGKRSSDQLALFKMPVHIWQYDEPFPKSLRRKFAKNLLRKKNI